MALQFKKNTSSTPKVPAVGALLVAEPAFDPASGILYIGAGESEAAFAFPASGKDMINIRNITASSTTIAASDHNSLLVMPTTGTNTITAPNGLPTGLRVDIKGPATISAPNLQSVDNLTKVSTNGAASLIHLGSDSYWLIGALE